VMESSLAMVEQIKQYYLGIFSLQWAKLYRKGTLTGLDRNLKPTQNLFIAVSELTWFGFEKRYFVPDSTVEGVADAMIASSWIPLITAPLFQPLFRIGTKYYGDGYWTGKDKIADRNKAIVIYPRIFERMSLSHYWLWLDRDRLVALFESGYAHAEKYNEMFSMLPKKADRLIV
jgi:hypothetical protein